MPLPVNYLAGDKYSAIGYHHVGCCCRPAWDRMSVLSHFKCFTCRPASLAIRPRSILCYRLIWTAAWLCNVALYWVVVRRVEICESSCVLARPCPRDWRYLLILGTSFTVCTMFVTSAYQFKVSDWYALGRLSISRYAILVRRYCTTVQLKTWVRVTEGGCELLNTRIDSTVLTHDKRWSVQLIKCPTSTQVLLTQCPYWGDIIVVDWHALSYLISIIGHHADYEFENYRRFLTIPAQCISGYCQWMHQFIVCLGDMYWKEEGRWKRFHVDDNWIFPHRWYYHSCLLFD